MRVTIELPRDWEVADVTVSKDGRSITLHPRFGRGARSCPVAYLTTTGDAGHVERARLSVSGTTGRFTTVGLMAKPQPTPFDEHGPDADAGEGEVEAAES